MLNYSKLYFFILKIFLNTLVKIKIIPSNTFANNKLNKNNDIIYLMHYKSLIDLIILRNQCIINHMPDPLEPIKINDIILSRCIFINNRSFISNEIDKKLKKNNYFNKYLNIDLKKNKIDIKVIPITLIIGRSPGKKNKNKKNKFVEIIIFIKKIMSIIYYGRDSFLILSNSISLQRIINMCKNNKLMIYKIIKIANNHFIHQKLISIGPKSFNRKDLFNKLLNSQKIIKLLKDHSKNKKNLYKKNKTYIIKIIKEIASNYSYFFIYITNFVIKSFLKKLYKKIYINGNNNLRELALKTDNIIYLPCHRSHMDYLLISYVLYHHGLGIPHIASGINLNFWPIGYILRKLGAFFIRRTFNVNKFYSCIFSEYLNELFANKYSIEYFIEGGRSRTGYLLNPKTGMLTLTLQSFIKNSNKKFILIPIYISYDNVIEIQSYSKELLGYKKEKEGFCKLIYKLLKIKNLGKAYINFGEPLNLNNFLNKEIPNWHKTISENDTNNYRPNWIITTAQNIANIIMIKINKASYVNEINLLATLIISSENNQLTDYQFIQQIQLYINFLLKLPYSNECIISKFSAQDLLKKAIHKNIYKNNMLILSYQQKIKMLYYRNNVHHIFIIPELIAIIIYKYSIITEKNLLYQVQKIYPILKNELFLHWSYDLIPLLVVNICKEFINHGLIIYYNNYYSINTNSNCINLKLFASNIKTNIQRYAIVFFIFKKNKFIKRNFLKKKYNMIAKNITFLTKDINKFEFFDLTILNVLLNSLKEQGYIKYITGLIESNYDKIEKFWKILSKLIDPDIKCIIEKNIQNNFNIKNN